MVDKSVKTVMNSPDTGNLKVGDLSGVSVFKFKVSDHCCPVKKYIIVYKWIYSSYRPISLAVIGAAMKSDLSWMPQNGTDCVTNS